MATEVKLAPMIENKVDAGPDDFFCNGCLAYHPPDFQSRDKEYCKFAFSIIHNKRSIIKDEPGWLDKPITDLLPASLLQAWEIEDKALERLYSRKPTPHKVIKRKSTNNISTKNTSRRVTSPVIKNQLNVTKKNRSLRIELPEEEIRNSTESGAVLALRYDTNKMMISRIRRGQRILDLVQQNV